MVFRNSAAVADSDSNSIFFTDLDDNVSVLSNDKTVKSEVIANRESALVKRTKKVMLVFLSITALLCSVAAYWFVKASEAREFEVRACNHAKEIISSSKVAAKTLLTTFENLSATITSYTLDRPAMNWPFVTLPHVHDRLGRVRDLTNTFFVGISPLVAHEDRERWEQFSAENVGWIAEGDQNAQDDNPTSFISPVINEWFPDGFDQSKEQERYFPQWQMSPVRSSVVNFDLLSVPGGAGLFGRLLEDRSIVVSYITSFLSEVDVLSTWPTSTIGVPIFEDIEQEGPVVGMLTGQLAWHTLFNNILPDNESQSMTVVVDDSCTNGITFRVEGERAVFQAVGDLHDRDLDNFKVSTAFNIHEKDQTQKGTGCEFHLNIYPTREYYESSKTYMPIICASVVFSIFVLTSLIFLVYDCLVQRRQKVVMTSAKRSNAIVSSLFPDNVRERMMDEVAAAAERTKIGGSAPPLQFGVIARKASIRSNESNGFARNLRLLDTKPIADLFPRATVMFADVCGFTAWSSQREPSQVFTLLEQIYGSFDVIAKRNRVFKVETIGDCYVAVAGLPEPRKDHALVMCKFAHESRTRLLQVVKDLEILLGPDTGDLGMRFGLHSGPVTAGVLRGEKSHFQLFGDTVNMAARIEQTGDVNMIHLSQETAREMQVANKADWIHKRKERVSAKGKGKIQTYFLTIPTRTRSLLSIGSFGSKRSLGSQMTSSPITPNRRRISAISSSTIGSPSASMSARDLQPRIIDARRKERLIEWSVQTLSSQLKKIMAMRSDCDHRDDQFQEKTDSGLAWTSAPNGESTVLDEVKEIISLSNEAKGYKRDPSTVELSSSVVMQLRSYVTTIATLYHDNSFHSFDHASHVTQSVTKLLARVVTADDIDYDNMEYKRTQGNSQLHQYTFGITSDPIIQFACAFSALVHDVDHQGISNAQLIAEGSYLAAKYNNKSVAEQNSVDLAWELLMSSEYADLRRCIYCNQEEMNRFRQLVVNSVMATDIVDKELGALRKARWANAFDTKSDDNSETEVLSESALSTQTDPPGHASDNINRKATIVIEHIIQASDVSHTMQHWHVYIKWNEKLFHEMYEAYVDGKSPTNPSEGWYQGELGFFDFYIIPLAKKLKECGVFGVASDEYLNYSMQNRAEWEQKGREIVQSYMSRYELKSSESFCRKDENSSRRASFISNASRSTNTSIDLESGTVCDNDDDDTDTVHA